MQRDPSLVRSLSDNAFDLAAVFDPLGLSARPNRPVGVQNRWGRGG